MKDIKGYEGIYAITKEGKVWSHWGKGRFLKTWLIGHGYEMVMLYKEGIKPKKFLVHRLVAINYIPNPKKLRETNHKNGKILDNRLINLEWVSSKENKIHAWKTGLYTHKGTNHYLAKLNPDKVREIRRIWRNGGITQRKISKMFKVSPMTICCVINGSVWGHIV